MLRHFVDLFDLSPEAARDLIWRALELKRADQQGRRPPYLSGRTLGLIFEKPSLRTRVSFEAAIAQLGGNAIFLQGKDVGMGVRESIADFARVISQYVDALAVRTFSHLTVEELARHATIPIINALSDSAHPCQAMADLMTIHEAFGGLDGLKLVFVGDGNNVARSLAFAAGKLKMKLVVASPRGYALDEDTIRRANGFTPDCTTQVCDPYTAVTDADVIYTDTWVSMGQENEKAKRQKDFAGYAVDAKLVAAAPKHVRIMHCLPAYRGYEITDEVAESPGSIMFDQAENRLHFQRALLKKLMA